MQMKICFILMRGKMANSEHYKIRKLIPPEAVAQNKDYSRSLTPVGVFDVFVPTAAIFQASKPEVVQ